MPGSRLTLGQQLGEAAPAPPGDLRRVGYWATCEPTREDVIQLVLYKPARQFRTVDEGSAAVQITIEPHFLA
jgi:hypothetical protein